MDGKDHNIKYFRLDNSHLAKIYNILCGILNEKFTPENKYSKEYQNLETKLNECLSDQKDIIPILLDCLLGNSTCYPLWTILKIMIKRYNALCSIIENPYFDSEFLENYISVYSRSFENSKRECTRIHFFQNDIFSALEKYINGKYDKNDEKLLQNNYLGFTTLVKSKIMCKIESHAAPL